MSINITLIHFPSLSCGISSIGSFLIGQNSCDDLNACKDVEGKCLLLYCAPTISTRDTSVDVQCVHYLHAFRPQLS